MSEGRIKQTACGIFCTGRQKCSFLQFDQLELHERNWIYFERGQWVDILGKSLLVKGPCKSFDKEIENGRESKEY